LEDLLIDLKGITLVDLNALKNQLPPTAFQIVYKKLINLMLGNLSADTQQIIDDELSSVVFAPIVPSAVPVADSTITN